MVLEFSKSTVTYLSTHTSYLFLSFSLFRNLWIVSSSFILVACYHIQNKQNLGPILGLRQNDRLKILFCFPGNPHIIKFTINLIIAMITFFKKSYAILLFSKQIIMLNDACHSDRQLSPFFPFYAILFTPSTFTVRYAIFLLHLFFTQKHFFRQNKIDDNTNERYGSVYWKGRFFNICILWRHTAKSHAHTDRPAENTENGRCVRVVWDNLKKKNTFITFWLIK